MYDQSHHAGSAQSGPAFRKFGKSGFGRYGKWSWGNGARRPKYNVPVNIIDNAGAFEVHVYALGFARENIKISVTDDVLYITGTRTVNEADEPNFRSQEYPIKSFERTIGLSDTIDRTAITARQVDGVLVVTLPKTKEAQQPAQEIKVD